MPWEVFIPAATASRIRDSSTTSSRGSPPLAGDGGRGVTVAGAGAGAAGAGAAVGAGAGAGAGLGAAGRAPPAAIAFSTSSRRIRPISPVPVIDSTARPDSATTRRTRGESSRPSRGAGADPPDDAPPDGAPPLTGPPAGAAGAPTAAGAEPLMAAPASPIRASTAPTGTVSPSGTTISSSTPSYGLGISESTLSVETSNSGSSKATVSPTDLSQRPTVPSVTDSPSFGMVISCAAAETAAGAEAGASAFSSAGGATDSSIGECSPA